MCKAHIVLQEPQAVTMMLCRMAFWLSSKVVNLHLGNCTSKAYLCNQGGAVSPFFQTGLTDIESHQQAQYYSYSSIHSCPSQCGSQMSVMGTVASRVASSSPHCLNCISTLGST